ncbi:MAG TPA: transcriptional regulator [Candidatus Mailhella merdavium]|nr:transcriptional regulator [Candidatus Mailhella merdavium]
MFKVVIFALVAYALYRMFMNDRKKSEEKSTKTQESRVAAGEMVKDPVCGAYVEKDSSITVRNGDVVHHFCSYECREKYLKQLEEQGMIER